MRGKPEQKPVIVPANGQPEPLPYNIPSERDIATSESDSDKESLAAGKSMPDAGRKSNQDPRSVPSSKNTQESLRGRRNLSKLDTEVERDRSTTVKPPRLERERSPYASGPRNSNAKDNRFSTDSLLSPSLDGPAPQSPRHHRSHSQNPPAHRQNDATKSMDKEARVHSRPQRPGMDRRASAMPKLEGSNPNSPSHSREKPGYYSSDESESEAARYWSKTSNLPPKQKQASHLETQHQFERRSNSKNPLSPPRSPLASDYPKSQGLNREALLNGAAASLNGLLDGPQRMASPRPSPQVSPNTSPYPSPPRTPPEPQRATAVNKLRSEPPNSRPSSPVSSSHKTQTAGSNRTLPAEIDARPQRFKPVSRATSPMPMARRQEQDLPKIDVRSPSPLPPRHSETTSQETNGPSTPNRYVPAYAAGALSLQPGIPERRQRSLSSSDARRPQIADLSIDPPKIHQHDVEYLSPTSKNTPSHFRDVQQNLPSLLSPTSNDAYHRNSLASPTSSSHRSRSAVPNMDQAPQRSPSANPGLVSRPRSRSTAAAPEIPYSDQRHPDPVRFPLCPHPMPMAGYKDWYTINGCEPFVICRECRYKIFGQGYLRQFKHHTPLSSTKEVHCAINDPWIRMACLASILKGSSDLTPVVNLALENEDRSSCPQRSPVRRDWYYLRDPEADENLPDFQVCSHCVHSIYALFPVLDRVFQRAEVPENEPLLCSIRSADPIRFGQYVSHCEKAQQAALKSGKRHPDMSDFIWYHKKETVISECTGDQVLIGRDWHRHPDVPQCTICEECYYEIVRPQIRRGHPIARAITPIAKHINDGVSCSLYSPRMKEVFKIACEEEDLRYLKDNVATRWDLQVQIMAAKMAVQQRPRDRDTQDEFDRLMRKWRRLEKEKYADSDSS